MSLSGFLEPCNRTEILIKLSFEELGAFEHVKQRDIVLFAAGPAEDYHLIIRVLSSSPGGLFASAAGYLPANLPGSDLAPFEQRNGIRRGLAIPEGEIYFNDHALDVLAKQPSTEPYATSLRNSYPGTPSTPKSKR